MSFNCKELVSLIKACGESGVLKFSLEGLSIDFLDKNLETPQTIVTGATSQQVLIQDVDNSFTALSEQNEAEITALMDIEGIKRGLLENESEETFHIGTNPTL